MTLRRTAAFLASVLATCAAAWCHPAQAAAARPAMAHYDHIFIMIGENTGFDQLMNQPKLTPNLHRLAAEYGLATQFYA